MKIELKGVIDTGRNQISQAALVQAFKAWMKLNGWKNEYIIARVYVEEQE